MLPDVPTDDMPPHLAQIGGAAAGGALLALPGALAAVAAEQGQRGRGRAHRRAGRRPASAWPCSRWSAAGSPQYLPYATVGLAGGATITACAAFPTDLPTAVYAAAAALLGVIAELLRGDRARPAADAAEPAPVDGRCARRCGAARRARPGAAAGRSTRPSARSLVGRAAHAARPRLARAGPASLALFDPFQKLKRIWEGPAPAAGRPAVRRGRPGTNVLAAVLLTVAAALAALGLRRAARAEPYR